MLLISDVIVVVRYLDLILKLKHEVLTV